MSYCNRNFIDWYWFSFFFFCIEKNFLVVFDSNGGSSVSSITILKGEKLKVPTDPFLEGYVFDYWAVGDEKFDFSTPITSDLTLKAVWKKAIVTFVITFDSDGGTSIVEQKVNEGDFVIKPNDPIKEGYIFKEWRLDGVIYDFNQPVTKDLTLNAFYEIKPKNVYTVSFDTDDGSSISNQILKSGEKVKEPVVKERLGYEFVNWTLNGKVYDFNSIVTSDISLKANWKKVKTYTVNFDTNGGSNITSKTVNDGKSITKPTNPTKQGYVFVEWLLNGKTYTFGNPVNENITLVASWKKVHKVTFDLNGGVTTGKTSVEVVDMNKVKKPVNPTKDGYNFLGWTLNGKTYDFNTSVSNDITLIATWEEKPKKTYSVTFDTNGGNTISTQTVIEGQKANQVYPIKEYYTFKEWQLNNVKYDFNTPVTKNITLKAVYDVYYIYADPTAVDNMSSTDGKIIVKRNGVEISFSKITTTNKATVCSSSDCFANMDDMKTINSFYVVTEKGEVYATYQGKINN